jgi:hypothetical protein
MGICVPCLLVTADEIVKPEAKFYMSRDSRIHTSPWQEVSAEKPAK